MIQSPPSNVIADDTLGRAVAASATAEFELAAVTRE